MRISAVVPTRNSVRTIAACLESLRNQAHPDVELIVVDNNSTDGTAAVGQRLADVFINAGPERSAQRNRGAEAATGAVILYIDSDMVLEPDVCTQVADRFAAEPALGALIIPERSFGDGFLVACRILEKSLYVGDDDVEAARAFRREVIERIGGWDESLTAAEDWELSDRMRAGGVQIGRIEAFIWHDEGQISLLAQYRKKQYYGRWVAEYLQRTADARSHVARPGVLAHPGPLLRDPLHAAGMLTLKAVEAAGLLRGMARARSAGQLGVDQPSYGKLGPAPAATPGAVAPDPIGEQR
jgi:glycosyltransferase involved in cell wall biosynthesis